MFRADSIAVKHNIEVAHRLFELPGKCEQIHGHSMWVELEIFGVKNDKGLLGGIEYGELKKLFRGYLDETYDHSLLLNLQDPYAGPIFMLDRDPSQFDHAQIISEQKFLPGLRTTQGDPTTENIAKWIAEAMRNPLEELATSDLFHLEVTVWETSVNMAKTSAGLERRS